MATVIRFTGTAGFVVSKVGLNFGVVKTPLEFKEQTSFCFNLDYSGLSWIN